MAERPKDLIYALDERPPAPQLLALGFQHAAAICPLVMVALVAGEAKLPQEAARNAMGLAMIAVGFLTILQSLRLTGYLSGLHADRIERSAKGEACEIKLFFRL